MIHFDPFEPVRLRAEAARALFEENGVEVIEYVQGDPEDSTGFASAASATSRQVPEGELDAIWAGWDASALGAYQATVAADRTEVIVTGVDGQEFAIAEVAKGGNWIATVRQDWPVISATVLDLIEANAAGEAPAEEVVFVPAVLITAENASPLTGSPATMILAGFDVGTTAVKGIYFDALDRRVVAETSWDYELSRPREGHAEQDPADFLAGLGVCRERLARLPRRPRRGGRDLLAGQHPRVRRPALAPVHPAISWQDQRCADAAAELERRAGDDKERIFGGPFSIDASYALSRALWLQQTHPDAWTERGGSCRRRTSASPPSPGGALGPVSRRRPRRGGRALPRRRPGSRRWSGVTIPAPRRVRRPRRTDHRGARASRPTSR